MNADIQKLADVELGVTFTCEGRTFVVLHLVEHVLRQTVNQEDNGLAEVKEFHKVYFEVSEAGLQLVQNLIAVSQKVAHAITDKMEVQSCL